MMDLTTVKKAIMDMERAGAQPPFLVEDMGDGVCSIMELKRHPFGKALQEVLDAHDHDSVYGDFGSMSRELDEALSDLVDEAKKIGMTAKEEK